MKLSFSFIGLLLTPLFILCANESKPLCQNHLNYTRCDYTLKTESLAHNNVPVFVYTSLKKRNKPVEYILFLHGRGYAREIGAKDSMLEHLKLNDFYKDQKNSDFVFIAPQDIFHHEDSQSIGQDYWIGKNDRDWDRFLGIDIPLFTKNLNQQLQTEGTLRTVLGISMGAHGALMLGQNYQNTYPQVIALSPIFRPTPSEIPTNDNDIFLKFGVLGLEHINFGTKLNHGTALLAERTYITISQTDFGLSKENFPNGRESWERLLDTKNGENDSFIEILSDERGHSMALWQDQLNAAFVWLFN